MHLFFRFLRGFGSDCFGKVRTVMLDADLARSPGSFGEAGLAGQMTGPRSAPGTDTGTLNVKVSGGPRKTCDNRTMIGAARTKTAADMPILALLQTAGPQTRLARGDRRFAGFAERSGARAEACAQSRLIAGAHCQQKERISAGTAMATHFGELILEPQACR
jgi:hypothetical protein